MLAAGCAAAVAGCGSARHVPAAEQGLLNRGRQVFVQSGCGGCHTLAAARTHGLVGPNFNRSERLNRAQILGQLDVGGGGMPPYRDRLTQRQKADVAGFLFYAMSHRSR